MPRMAGLRSVLVIGSGPIVIGQACEFDYSGTQGIRVLREEGLRVILVNSNPATIMTDPELADATYLEPVVPEIVEGIIARERPDALLPTLGGQTALNVTSRLASSGVLDRHGVRLIGAGLEAIEAAENRGAFRDLMEQEGMATPRSVEVGSVEEGEKAAGEIGFPVMVRPSFILGGGGTSLVSHPDRLEDVVGRGLSSSPVGRVLIEESVAGWQEFELEVMRDGADNAVVVCSIENLDPMGIHTGDSTTVAPALTLSDREYQEMRDEALYCLRAVGVETGGSNVQFAIHPESRRRLVIEMNPRVSRSSALASKATGFPIAKIATRLALGYRLDEIRNDITRRTPACFEPVLDYVAVKIPRFDFAKFPEAPNRLGTSMRSVGEVMALARTFPEALQKAVRSLEIGREGLLPSGFEGLPEDDLAETLENGSPERLFLVAEALRRGHGPGEVAHRTGIHGWFIDRIADLVECAGELGKGRPGPDLLREAKRAGFSDGQIAALSGLGEGHIRVERRAAGIEAVYKTVDTCAAEFEAATPYFYRSFEVEDEVPAAEGPSVVVLGSGPNRIGQGVEFDYCCVHAVIALREAGFRTVMVNCNPETVSTDYDTSDRLYFEPVVAETVLEIIERERPGHVIVQLGGQTPLNLTARLSEAGVPIAGTPASAIARAEDRRLFSDLCLELGIAQPPFGLARTPAEAQEIVDRIGLPVLLRPSYVLGGRAMRIVYDVEDLTASMRRLAERGKEEGVSLESAPVLIDRFLESAVEVDVDAVFDGRELLVGGVLEHVQEAGVHSGDSACVTPPPGLTEEAVKRILRHTEDLAAALGVRGLLNVQFAVRDGEVFVLEANPRASRTVPFVSKATGIPLAKLAARVMVGSSLADLRAEGVLGQPSSGFVAVKEAVLPWDRFPEADVILGPEMRATGEVMGLSDRLGAAYGKAMLAAGHELPVGGTVFLSLADRDKPAGVDLARRFAGLGFRLVATENTARHLADRGIPAIRVDKVGEGAWDPVRLLAEGMIQMMVNTPRGRRARGDGRLIRASALRHGVPCITSIAAARAALESLSTESVEEVRSLQEWHGWT